MNLLHTAVNLNVVLNKTHYGIHPVRNEFLVVIKGTWT